MNDLHFIGWKNRLSLSVSFMVLPCLHDAQRDKARPRLSRY
jgi:hypothetical protein